MILIKMYGIRGHWVTERLSEGMTSIRRDLINKKVIEFPFLSSDLDKVESEINRLSDEFQDVMFEIFEVYRS